MPPKELLDLVTGQFGPYAAIFLFAGYFLWQWATSTSARKQKRLEDQERTLDEEWAKIRVALEGRIAELANEIREIRSGHASRVAELSSQLVAKSTEIEILKKALEVMRKDMENGWDRGRGTMRLLRDRYHETNNERQRVDALLRHHNLPPMIWSLNPEPPDLADVPPVKG